MRVSNDGVWTFNGIVSKRDCKLLALRAYLWRTASNIHEINLEKSRLSNKKKETVPNMFDQGTTSLC